MSLLPPDPKNQQNPFKNQSTKERKQMLFTFIVAQLRYKGPNLVRHSKETAFLLLVRIGCRYSE
jgi:hypothetical protein